MRWKSNRYNIGDKRTITKFAFFPTEIGPLWIWFESYIAEERFQDKYFSIQNYGWTEVARGLKNE